MALARDIFNRLKSATDKASNIVLNETSFGGSRTRMDDNVGGNVVDDLATMLKTNPAFKSWYLGLQKRERDEGNIDRKRRFELMLMYPFQYYASTLTGKAKSDWEGSVGTSRDSDFDPTRGGEVDNDVHFADMGRGNATNQYMSDAQREEVIRNRTELSQSHKYTLESTGKYGTKHEQNPADNVMTAQFLTKLIREANKQPDEKIMTVLCALLLRWGVNLPTYLNRRDVPSIWWRMVSYCHKNGGIYKNTKNLRTFLTNFGIAKFGGDSSPQMREIRNIMMRITDSKTVGEIYRTLTSPQANNQYGDAGKAKNYFDIDVTARRNGHINESVEGREVLISALLNIDESMSFKALFRSATLEMLAILSHHSDHPVE